MLVHQATSLAMPVDFFYDCFRRRSRAFQNQLVKTLADGGIKSYSFDGVNPNLPVPFKARFRVRRAETLPDRPESAQGLGGQFTAGNYQKWIGQYRQTFSLSLTTATASSSEGATDTDISDYSDEEIDYSDGGATDENASDLDEAAAMANLKTESELGGNLSEVSCMHFIFLIESFLFNN